jgi:hypothetical protein
LLKGFVAGLAVVGLGTVGVAGCTASGLPAPSAGSSLPAALKSAAASRAAASTATSMAPKAATSTAPRAATSTAPKAATTTAPPAAPVSPQLRAGAQAAAAQAFGLYGSGQFAAFWSLLSPAAKRQVPRNAWVSIHEACSPARDGKPGAVEAVTVFGNAAIVTEAITGTPPRTSEVVFNYVNGEWSYSPGDLSVYDHGSVAADIAAAKAAGYCGSWKIF